MTLEAARPYRAVELSPRDGRTVVYGGGETGSITAKAQLGEIEALVVDGLQENLVALSDFTNRGSTVVLSCEGGVVSNSNNDKVILLTNDVGTWRLRLSDVATYNHLDSNLPPEAFYTTTPKTKADRYISLHERLGHLSPNILAA